MPLSRRQALLSLGALSSFSALPSGLALARCGRASDLLGAVRSGDLARVRALLDTDPSLAGCTDELGRSAFVLAHLGGHAEVAATLHATGLELDVVEAVLAEDWARVDSLAQADPACLHAAHPIGGTPLYAAALVGSHDFYRLRSLGCTPDAAPEGGTGFTPARGALDAQREEWARIGLCDLCGNGSDVNAEQQGGSSVLLAAVHRRSALLVRLAIRKGADPLAIDAQGRTALDVAHDLGWGEGAALLAAHEELPRDHRASRFALDANREPIVRPDVSDVPQELQSEVTGKSHFDLAAVRGLVSKDERLVFSISTDDELAIEACAHTGAHDIIRLHLDHGAPLSLPTAVSLGDLDAIRFWLERDSRLVHERGAHDFPLMWLAVTGGGSIEVAELLVEHGADVDQESMGTTALHLCVRHEHLDLARWLLEGGADPEAVGHKWSRSGETPLALARQNGAFDALLRDAGATR